MATITNDVTKLKSMQDSLGPAEMFMALMRLLQVHRVSLEASSKRSYNRVSEVNTGGERPATPWTDGLKEAALIQQVTSQVVKNCRDQFQEMLGPHIESLKTANPAVDCTPSHRCQEEITDGAMMEDVNSPPWAPNQVRMLNYGQPTYGPTNSGTSWRPNPSWGAQNTFPPRQYQNFRPQGGQQGYGMPGGMSQPYRGGQATHASGPSRNEAGYMHPGQNPRYGSPNQTNQTGLRFPGQVGRQILPDEVYNKHFNTGKCFKCALEGHSFRKCPQFPSENTLTNAECPSCKADHIVAYHKDCGGKIGRLHKSQAASNTGPNISEIQMESETLGGNEEPDYIASNTDYPQFPQYCAPEWPQEN